MAKQKPTLIPLGNQEYKKAADRLIETVVQYYERIVGHSASKEEIENEVNAIIRSRLS